MKKTEKDFKEHYQKEQLPPEPPDESADDDDVQMFDLDTFDAIYEVSTQSKLHEVPGVVIERYTKDLYELRGKIRFRHVAHFCEKLNCNYQILRTFKSPAVNVEYLSEGLYCRPDTCHADLVWNDISQEEKEGMTVKNAVVWQQVINCKGKRALSYREIIWVQDLPRNK